MTDSRKAAPDSKCPLYAPGSCPLCDAIAHVNVPGFQLVRRAAGSVLLRHGFAVNHVIQVQSGRLKLSAADASGAERAYAMRGPGSIVGLEALLGLPTLLNARVDIEGEFVLAKPTALERWLEEASIPAVAVIRHVVAENVRLIAERLLVDGNSEARVARFLLEREQSPYLSAWNRVARQEVAGLLSMRPETLSRAIRVLQDRHAIGPGLEIRDIEELRRVAKEDGPLA